MRCDIIIQIGARPGFKTVLQTKQRYGVGEHKPVERPQAMDLRFSNNVGKLCARYA